MSILTTSATIVEHPGTGWRCRALCVIRVLLGILLLAAASLKVYGWSVSTVPPVSWFSAPSIQAVAIGWEIFLGAWLLSAVLPLGSWLASLGTFTLLAGISGYLGWIGQTSCGCFGTIEASPWDAFTVDVGAVVFLAAGLPTLRTTNSSQRDALGWNTSSARYTIFGVGALLAAVVSIGAWRYGSPEIALAHLRGGSISVSSGYVDFGIGNPGDVLEAQVEVRNWTDKPVRLIGGTSDCSCITSHGLPATLAPGEVLAIPVQLRIRQTEPGIFSRIVEFWTDPSERGKIRFRARYRVE